ncbi:peptidase domain-containing ABC transporter [Stenotrophomonas rhizophila]|uniref:peptidase domain-containing ABC transporter n=1 Tax=Stenotrophomonas rhizophila TaxID=216778 RepID=UPI0028ADD63F|nr:peptidase domain-containing ABC transporter [Stenotrophomonas rhizophila]MDY0956282.1 peptidase domain-containing ABC transporter [Stenotrophomonas rhizophila]
MINEILRPDSFVRQSEAGECGLACLAMVAAHHGDKRDLAQLRRVFPTSARGATLKSLIFIAEQVGFHARPLRTDIASLSRIPLPAILHWDLNHFVVLDAVKETHRGRRYRILDPAKGVEHLAEQELGDHYTGIALELTPTSKFAKHRAPERLRLTQLWSKMRGLPGALGRILLLSVMMQVITLVTPYYMQLAVDTALPSSDVEFLTLLAIGFGGLLFFSALMNWARSFLVLNLGANLSLQSSFNLFRHTIFLPTSWFEKRHLGDVVSRFSSLQPISDLLSKGLVSSVVDGALAVTTLILMAVYSVPLTCLVLVVVATYALVKIAFFRSMAFANANVLTAQAVESTAFMENIRGVQTIKMFCKEGDRQRLWQAKKADYVVGSLRLGRMTSGFDAVNALVVSLENVVFVYVAIRIVLAGSLTLGMVFAFQAYKQNFVASVIRLIDQLMSYRLLDVHLSRLSDLALQEAESEAAAAEVEPISTIELRGVTFSYGLGLPNVLNDVNLSIKVPDSLAIVGPSGGGKTTLMKILSGLLIPTSGIVLVNGRALADYGTRSYRSQFGSVAQDDSLFAGSIAENIAFFDPEYSIESVFEAASLAGISDEINRMPMKFDTPVGDMGSTLSGGQKQRILLARALYKRPRILLMDEATAHLDVPMEKRVIGSVESTGVARIIVAHRPDAIRSVRRVVSVIGGKVEEVPLGSAGRPGEAISAPIQATGGPG